MVSEYEKRVANVMKWLPGLLEEKYDERRMGHLLEKHLNIKDEHLINRMMRERKYCATSFYGEKSVVIAALQKVLIDNAEEIAMYLADRDDNEIWIIEDEMPAEISGSGFYATKDHNWDDGAVECDMVRIAIKKSDNGNEPIILSIYPIC